MLRKLLFIVVFVAVLATAVTTANAGYYKFDYDWDGEAWWSGFGSDDPQMWDTSNNWWGRPGGGNPIARSGDWASVGDPSVSAQATIDGSVTAVCKYLMVGDYKPNSSLTITGGSLTVERFLVVGNLDTIWGLADGVVEITGGTVTIGGFMHIGVDGIGDVNVGNGIDLTVGGDLIIGTDGHLLVTGPDGRVILGENQIADVSIYIGGGKVYSSAGYLAMCEYDTLVADKTVIFAQVIDPCQAKNPAPVGPDAQLLDIELTWTAGDACSTSPDSHDVYYGSSYIAVRDANTGSGEFQVNLTDPCTAWKVSESLAYGDTRFWRIDERYGGDVVKGNVWNLTTRNYLLIETFNKDVYADEAAMLVVWSEDGGADVEVEILDFSDQISGSDQAMRIDYYNGSSPYLSETKRTFDPNENWQAGGSTTLAIYVHGAVGNSDENIYVILTDDDSGSDYATFPSQPLLLQQTRESWHLWLIPLTDFSGVDESIIKSITLGIGNKASPASNMDGGSMYFEDIRVYPPACFATVSPFITRDDVGDFDGDCDVDDDDLVEFTEDWLDANYTVSSAVAPNPAGLVLHYKFDETTGTDIKDEIHDDANHNAKLTAQSWTTSGKYAGALDLTDSTIYAVIPPNAIDADIAAEATLSFWIKTDGQDNAEADGTSIVNHGGISSYMPYNGNIGAQIGCKPDSLRTGDNVLWGPKGGFSNPDYDYGVWNHIACVKSLSDGRSGTIKLYYNGELVAKDNADWPTKNDVNEDDNEFAYIGCWINEITLEGFFKGLLDDMRLYDYALSDEEVLSLAEKTSMSQPCVAIANLSGDTKVDFTDLAIFASDWNSEPLWP